MNKDIQSLIEREAKEYMYSEKYPTGHYTDIQIEQYHNESFIDGANYALSLFKWRKVEDEMPEIGFRVLIKNDFNVVFLGYIDTIGDWRYCLDNRLMRFKPIEWMPIPDND